VKKNFLMSVMFDQRSCLIFLVYNFLQQLGTIKLDVPIINYDGASHRNIQRHFTFQLDNVLGFLYHRGRNPRILCTEQIASLLWMFKLVQGDGCFCYFNRYKLASVRAMRLEIVKILV